MSDIQDKLKENVAAGQWGEVVHDCEQYELKTQMRGGNGDAAFYNTFMIAYLITNDLDNARFLHKRLPDGIAKDGDMSAIWLATQCLWNKKLPEFHAAISAHQWQNPNIAPALQEAVRERTLQLYSRAYLSVAVKDLAAVLGVSPDDALKRAEAQKVVKKVEGDFIHFQASKAPQKATTVDGVVSNTGMNTLKKLCNHVLFMEK
eukprot:TRINITY_DN77471_c0_g1_i1.p1 TRINITY_DN77471_c0_g1~~TRINITY_DN77471_c0_g1_i1.p1  ORF type:complete len:217 (+),score=32.58 TRINITY_DN77471_c0_g1_i1:41-652(+)